MYDGDEIDDRESSIRKILLKVLLIIFIILLLVFIVPKFLSYQHKVKAQNSNSSSKIETEVLTKLESTGIKYFNEDNIPTEVNQNKKVTLAKLKEQGLIKNLNNGSQKCDDKKSYIMLTKTSEDYILKTVVVSGSNSDYKLLHVGKYDYCNSTLLCEKKTDEVDLFNQDEEKQGDDNSTSSNNTNSDISNAKIPQLSAFTEWSEYQNVSCDTNEVTCDINDTTCLKEIRVLRKEEAVGTTNKTFDTEHTALKLERTENRSVCSDYNYLVINNVIFRTKGNYEEILTLNKKDTQSWTYRGQISINNSPSFGANEYYKYAGANTDCDGCLDTPLYYYDSYKYNYRIDRVTSFTSGCSSKTKKQVGIYTVYKQKESYTKSEKKYQTICYASERTRSYN